MALNAFHTPELRQHRPFVVRLRMIIRLCTMFTITLRTTSTNTPIRAHVGMRR